MMVTPGRELRAAVPGGIIAGWQAGTGPAVLGADSPIPPGHGIATAALIPGAQYAVEPDCGHFAWLERPGSVRQALASICR